MTDLFKNYLFVISVFLTVSIIGYYVYLYVSFLNNNIRDLYLRIRLLNATIDNSLNISKDIPVTKLRELFTEQELAYLGIQIPSN